MHARDQGVSELVLVGPSDGIAGGVAEHSRALRRDASVQAALDRHSSQVKGVAADLDSSRAASPSTSSASGGHKAPLRPLAAEEVCAALCAASAHAPAVYLAALGAHVLAARLAD